MNTVPVFKAYLMNNGLRPTSERMAILSEVSKKNSHFEADELYLELRKNNKSISRASVYRTLPILVECGLLRELAFDEKRKRYEFNYGLEHHEHLVCKSCGKIIEFQSESLELELEKAIKKHEFTQETHRVEVIGYCKKCMKKDTNGGDSS